jgi:molybdopterin-guanine dinucleotide biosynthesis protein A
MLCWREEKKHWITIYDELLSEITFNAILSDEIKGALVLKITTLKYVDFPKFRQTIFEVINYVESLRSL